jgi:hypothetical protein
MLDQCTMNMVMVVGTSLISDSIVVMVLVGQVVM